MPGDGVYVIEFPDLENLQTPAPIRIVAEEGVVTVEARYTEDAGSVVEIRLSEGGQTLEIEWGAPNSRLQRSHSILGPWTDIPGASPASVPVGENESVLFFRLTSN